MEAEQKRKAVIRSSIIRGGYKFIKLVLLKENLRRISAVETLTPYLVEDEATGKRVFKYVPGSDKVYFEFDEMEGVFTAEVLDTERNRKWLASMATARMFEISDETVRNEINKLSKSVTKTIIKEISVVEDEDIELNKEISENVKKDEVAEQPALEALTEPKKPVVKKQPKKGIAEFED